MPCVQHASSTNLWRHVTLTRRTSSPSLERQLGHSDPELLANKSAEDKHAEQDLKNVFVSHQQRPQQSGTGWVQEGLRGLITISPEEPLVSHLSDLVIFTQ